MDKPQRFELTLLVRGTDMLLDYRGYEHGGGCVDYFRYIALFMDSCVSWSLWFVGEENRDTFSKGAYVPYSVILPFFVGYFATLSVTTNALDDRVIDELGRTWKEAVVA
jgi:hypothetical protein